MTDPAPLHATLAARYSAGCWRGVLLRGPSGAGKSGLALSLIGRGWRLVADDRVRVWPSGGRVWGRSPEVLRGLLEVRGLGVLPFSPLDFSSVDAVVDGLNAGEAPERAPLAAVTRLCGVDLPVCRFDLLDGSSADKVCAFCDALRL